MGKRQESAKLTRQKIIDAVRTLSETKRFDEMITENKEFCDKKSRKECFYAESRKKEIPVSSAGTV